MNAFAQTSDTRAPGFGPARSQLALIAVTDFTVWLGSGAILPYLPIFLKEQAHASLTLIALIASAYFVGVFAFSSYFGHLSDRVGRRPMIIAGTVLYAVATALLLTTTQPAWFIVFRLIEGAGTAAVVPAAQAFVADITVNENRSRAYGWLTSAQFTGLIIGPALAWPLYALGGGHGRWAFATIFIFGAALTAIVAVVLALFLREPAHGSRLRSRDRVARPPLRVLLTRPVIAIIVVVATAEFAMGAWEVVWSLWLRHIGAPMRVIGLTWIAFSLPVAFSFIGGRVADRANRFALMAWGFGIVGASWFAFSLTHNLIVYLAAMLIGGVAFAVSFPAKQAFLVQVAQPRWLGSVQGVEQTAMQLSALVGTLTAPLLYGLVGGAIFAIGGAVALGGLVVALPTLRREWACVSESGGARSCADARRRAVDDGYGQELPSEVE
ncbi:MAG TPA: MFS transporter [Thermoleophilia bacterium]|nr:MFS transporter [Thermoleophilia bacterium]